MICNVMNYRKVQNVLQVFFIAIGIFTLRPYYWPELPWGEFGKNRLQIKCMATTGPEYMVLEGNKQLRQGLILPDTVLSHDGIEVTGNTPESLLPCPACYDVSYIIHGSVEGVTHLYEGTSYGIVPLFRVDKIKVAGYLPAVLYMNMPIPLKILCLLITGLFILSMFFRLFRFLMKQKS